VANNYRNGDFTPYAFHTSDFGKTWERIAGNEQVFGYVLCILQDPEEPKLVFLGTEHGLWISIDKGKNWTRWTHGYPAVSTIDLAIQKREADLVIGTFGRSIYILDDIRPLRKIAATSGELLEKPISLFEPAEAIIVDGTEAVSGSHFPADAIFSGENKPIGATIKVFVKLPKETKKQNTNSDEKRKKADKETTSGNNAKGGEQGAAKNESKSDSLKIKIYNDSNALIKTITQKPDSGINVIRWSFDEGELKMPTRGSSQAGRRGFGNRSRGNKTALPGTYKILAEFKGNKDSAQIKVIFDPRIPKTIEALKAQREMIDDLTADLGILYNGTERLIESKEVAGKVSAQIKGVESENVKELQKAVKTVQDSIIAVQDFIFGKENPDAQGITSRTEITVTSKVFEAMRYIGSRPGMPTATEERLVAQSKLLMVKCVEKINTFYENTWPEFRKKVEETDIPLFKNYEPLQLK